MTDQKAPAFVLGNKVLADKLGAAVVGDPLENETYFPDGVHSLQMTTKGFIMYSNGVSGFVPFAEPEQQ